MRDESIRQHVRSAMSAFASCEAARGADAPVCIDAGTASRVRTMRPLMAALKAVSDETQGVAGLTILAMAGGAQARIEMVGAAGLRHSLLISTDPDNRRFEVEETQYFPLSGDPASYLHYFGTAEEVLQFSLQLIGAQIAIQQSAARTPA